MEADEVSPESASVLQALRGLVPTLRGATERAATHILERPADAGRSSITQLAAAAAVSASTLTRLASMLGHDGFPSLRAAIATEHGRELQGGWARDIGSEIAPDDPPERVLSSLGASMNRAVRGAAGTLDLEAASSAADWIAAAGRIHLYGDWGDGVALHELYLRLLRIGRPVWWHEGMRAAHIAAGLLGEGDVAVTLSRSGRDAVAVDFCARARAHGARTVVITGDPDSTLARQADAALFTGTREGAAWTDYFTGRTSDTLTAAMLWVLVAQRVPDGLGAAMASDTAGDP